jgi:1-deoxy-D-xylulose-5-phosphate synthase
MLEKIDSPEDLKPLSIKELKSLSSEIRERIVSTVAKTGGHLASSLGVVEIAIALHYVFDSPKDKIIWDVGHQSYAHKLLTGRRERFSTLRQEGGISGFPKRQESKHDPFNTGHSSTSISAALGIAIARDLTGEDYRIIAVIGDGAISSGMAFEALNYAGQIKSDILVILNSNEMAISETVGALSNYLNRLITLPVYTKFRRDMNELISRLPLGKRALKLSHRIEEGIKGMIVPGVLFEELGFRYIGPIDGHNLSVLIRTLKAVKRERGPILVHIITKKGKGYKPAEEKPEWFHGTSPFDIETGEPKKRRERPSYSEVFGDSLCELARRNRKIVAITAAMKEGCGLVRFAEEFSDRFFDVGIAEEHAVTMASGMATEGLRPVVAIYSTFLQRAYDQIVHDVCLQNLPVCFAVDRAGIVGEDGETHQGLLDLAYLSSAPNMVVTAPRNGTELFRLLATAISSDRPFAIRYPRDFAEHFKPDATLFDIPEAEVLMEGSDCLVIAVGSMVSVAEKALSMADISATLIDCRFIKPLDKRLILSHLKGKVVVVEEHSIFGGLSSQIAQLLSGKAEILQIGLPDRPIEHGERSKILEKYGLSPKGVAEKIESFVKEL